MFDPSLTNMVLPTVLICIAGVCHFVLKRITNKTFTLGIKILAALCLSLGGGYVLYYLLDYVFQLTNVAFVVKSDLWFACNMLVSLFCLWGMFPLGRTIYCCRKGHTFRSWKVQTTCQHRYWYRAWKKCGSQVVFFERGE